MKFFVDTCGWLEWLTDGVLADEFAHYLNALDNLIIPKYQDFSIIFALIC